MKYFLKSVAIGALILGALAALGHVIGFDWALACLLGVLLSAVLGFAVQEMLE